MRATKRFPLILTIWLLLTLLLSAIALFFTMNSLAQDTQDALQQRLPPRLNAALQYSLADASLYESIQQRIDEDLALLPIIAPLALVQSCGAQVLRLRAREHIEPLPRISFMQRVIRVHWEYGRETQQSILLYACEVRWVPLLSSRALLALLCVGLISLLPTPISAGQMAWRNGLLAAGVATKEALSSARLLSLVEIALLPRYLDYLHETGQGAMKVAVLFADPRFTKLTPKQDAWVRCALHQHGDIDRALQIGLAPAALYFTSQNWSVTLHGMTITLSKTPWFYYVWYAYLRHQELHDGWLLNPAINRPEQLGAHFISGLMTLHGGHNRAIKELQEKGLRAKTLDQNRNKIKEELLSLVDETLANDFLFETNRDSKSGRYAYRLRTSSEQIHFDLCLRSSLNTLSKPLKIKESDF